jgi:hypothetical protein
MLQSNLPKYINPTPKTWLQQQRTAPFLCAVRTAAAAEHARRLHIGIGVSDNERRTERCASWAAQQQNDSELCSKSGALSCDGVRAVHDDRHCMRCAT